MTKDGNFLPPEPSAAILRGESSGTAEGDPSFAFDRWVHEERIDIAFPLIHGTTGEDGTLQGYLEFLRVPYVGSGVTASAIGMDKALMKQAFATAKLPIVESVTVSEQEWREEREKVSRAIPRR